ncbi:hypothetical protein [Yersinia enterocolitica]|uniref:hypothetical protein n=1 Tax=Yersinia enterocolitica TaxID=630 RepID=UPI001C60B3D1|nr:hypothetical protein [Yersinia enterocolitica]MBW5822997.1 hypothetical protein [Yersinia enterocolitica]MBW5852921.1 hypothetical protein [Yersinia enterocolitica]MBW5879113.1 hypothetical protein [Yersinia enterocolitica]MBX9477033.1 hypothetical protein [Yersinia enterocolitica]
MSKDHGFLKSRPIGNFVRVFLDAATYAQLKAKAKSERKSMAKEAAKIIENYFWGSSTGLSDNKSN